MVIQFRSLTFFNDWTPQKFIGSSSSSSSSSEELFALYDVNENGTISRDELAKVIRGLGENPTEDELNDIFKELDSDGIKYLYFYQRQLHYFNNHYITPELLIFFKKHDRRY